MQDDDLTPTAGTELAAYRETAGISQLALAERLGIHRTSLWKIETAEQVDVVRAARYRKAVRELVDEAVGAA